MFETFRARIYSAPLVIDQLADYLRSGFIVQGTGIWLGKREHAAILEVVGDESEIDRLISRATQLATDAGETSILATATQLSAALVTGNGERLPVVSSILETIR